MTTTPTTSRQDALERITRNRDDELVVLSVLQEHPELLFAASSRLINDPEVVQCAVVAARNKQLENDEIRGLRVLHHASNQLRSNPDFILEMILMTRSWVNYTGASNELQESEAFFCEVFEKVFPASAPRADFEEISKAIYEAPIGIRNNLEFLTSVLERTTFTTCTSEDRAGVVKGRAQRLVLCNWIGPELREKLGVTVRLMEQVWDDDDLVVDNNNKRKWFWDELFTSAAENDDEEEPPCCGHEVWRLLEAHVRQKEEIAGFASPSSMLLRFRSLPNEVVRHVRSYLDYAELLKDVQRAREGFNCMPLIRQFNRLFGASSLLPLYPSFRVRLVEDHETEEKDLMHFTGLHLCCCRPPSPPKKKSSWFSGGGWRSRSPAALATVRAGLYFNGRRVQRPNGGKATVIYKGFPFADGLLLQDLPHEKNGPSWVSGGRLLDPSKKGGREYYTGVAYGWHDFQYFRNGYYQYDYYSLGQASVPFYVI